MSRKSRIELSSEVIGEVRKLAGEMGYLLDPLLCKVIEQEFAKILKKHITEPWLETAWKNARTQRLAGSASKHPSSES